MTFSEKSDTSSKSSTAQNLPSVRGKCINTVCAIMITLMITVALPVSGKASTTGRFWSYLNVTSLIDAKWAIVTMPGFRYEFARSDDPSMLPAKGLYFYEFFIGPVYSRTSGAFTFKLPVWYYYMGFPSDNSYFYSHNIEILPILTYRTGRTTFTSRTIFHNTVYASVYETSEMRKGYSLVIRQLLQVAHCIDERTTLIIADEPFFGVIEDGEAPPSPIGFWPSGFRLNRIYAGLEYSITPRIRISPQYVLETAHDEGTVTDVNHYLFVTFTYVLRLF